MQDPYGSNDLDLFTGHDLRTRQQARLLVASRADSAEDCRALLQTLDLIDHAAASMPRRCPRCGAVHERWGSSARSRFCSEACAVEASRERQDDA